MNCVVPINCSQELSADDQAHRDALQQEPLAFKSSGDPQLVQATSRIGVPVQLPVDDSNYHNQNLVWINVEVFEQNSSASTSPLVVYIPGICE